MDVKVLSASQTQATLIGSAGLVSSSVSGPHFRHSEGVSRFEHLNLCGLHFCYKEAALFLGGAEELSTSSESTLISWRS